MFRGTERFPRSATTTCCGALERTRTLTRAPIAPCTTSSRARPRSRKSSRSKRTASRTSSTARSEFQKEAGAVLGEYNKSAASPFMGLYEKLQDDGLRRPPLPSTWSSAFSKTSGRCRRSTTTACEFFDRFYRPEYATLLVVGDYDWEELGKARRRALRRLGARRLRPRHPRGAAADGSPGGRRLRGRRPDAPHPRHRLSSARVQHRARRHARPRRALAGALRRDVADLSGAGDRKAVGRLRAAPGPQTRPTLLFSPSSPGCASPSGLDDVRKALLAEVDRIGVELVETDELEATKSHMKYQFLLGLDTADAVANTMAHYLSLTNDPRP